MSCRTRPTVVSSTAVGVPVLGGGAAGGERSAGIATGWICDVTAAKRLDIGARAPVAACSDNSGWLPTI